MTLCVKCKRDAVCCGLDGFGECCICGGARCKDAVDVKTGELILDTMDSKFIVMGDSSKSLKAVSANTLATPPGVPKDRLDWPVLPAEFFWRISKKNLIGEQEIQLRKDSLLWSRKVDYISLPPKDMDFETINTVSRAVLRRNTSVLGRGKVKVEVSEENKHVGEYGRKSVIEKDIELMALKANRKRNRI